VSSPSFLICCTSPDQARGQELECWLEKTIARFEPEMGMCRAPAAGVAGHARPGQPREQVWFLTVGSEDAVDPMQLGELLAEMRLLGLNPRVFQPGRLPRPDRNLASFF
jgi:hypothetical protein